ncbi:rhamnogalacturonan acetylesterase [Mesobacillus foraminis]|uniref:rhamnogalacturonan acetylesterase n=1 Tax=Mesobacillus foraminis TaxID=279826 RepID=UPI001BE7C944|nr:rhamnogalacturonan acetylesterase [Mesobacillus foraminis]MBT2758995.1 rhamnogalacturonan acetylesterase [Mesobacillus foraminis]
MLNRIKEKSLAASIVLVLSSLLFGNLTASASTENSNKNTISVYLAGDSTVSSYDQPLAPRMGWGQVLDRYFDDKIVVKNEASSGRSSKSFIDEGRLDAILDEIEKGDYLFIQFGHNDQKIEDPSRYTEPYSTYKSYLKQYIDGARAKNALPVLVTPVERRRFTAEGLARDSHGEYPAAMKELAKEENVPVIDLTAKSKSLFQELGPEATKEVFLWLEPGEHMNYPEGVQDNTHFQEAGAEKIAVLVAEGLKELKLVPLRNHLYK